MSMRTPNPRPVAISGSDDDTVRVWDLKAGAPMHAPLEGHHGNVKAVAAGELHGHPIAVSGGNDRTVRVWDLDAGGPLGAPLAGHGSWVTAVAIGELPGPTVGVAEPG
jgi:eukaryotic-like serine/threonine-protein kinase